MSSESIIAKEDLNSSHIVGGQGKKPKSIGNPKLYQLSYYFELQYKAIMVYGDKGKFANAVMEGMKRAGALFVSPVDSKDDTKGYIPSTYEETLHLVQGSMSDIRRLCERSKKKQPPPHAKAGRMPEPPVPIDHYNLESTITEYAMKKFLELGKNDRARVEPRVASVLKEAKTNKQQKVLKRKKITTARVSPSDRTTINQKQNKVDTRVSPSNNTTNKSTNNKAEQYQDSLRLAFLAANSASNNKRDSGPPLAKASNDKKIASKDKEKEAALMRLAREEIAMLKQSIVKKDMELEGKAAEIAKKDRDLAKKDERLKDNELDIARKDKQIEYMKSVVKQQRGQIRQLESILDPVDLTTDDESAESPNKRTRTGEDTPKSTLALQHELIKEAVKVKEENINDYVSFLQSKIEELASVAEAGGADKDKVAEIKGRLRLNFDEFVSATAMTNMS